MEPEAVKEWLWAFARESLHHAVLLIGPDGDILWASPGAGWILGATAAEIVHRPLSGFFTPADCALGVPAHELGTAVSRGSSEDDRWMVRADGSRFWASGRTVVLRQNDGALLGYCKIFRDATDIEARLSMLANQVAMLAAQNEHRARAIITIAHELRNPLASLALTPAIMRQRTIDPSLQAPLDIIERNTRFATQLVEDLETAIRVRRTETQFAFEPLPLEDVLQPALDNALHRIPADARDIRMLLPPGMPIVVEGGRWQLQQAFANLIGNALKFTADDGRIWINATVESGEAVVRIQDDGIGIDHDALASIFDMFTQARTPVPNGGFGIGLALVKTIVEQHGGSVQANSAGIGKGSEFTVRVPLRQAPETAARRNA